MNRASEFVQSATEALQQNPPDVARALLFLELASPEIRELVIFSRGQVERRPVGDVLIVDAGRAMPAILVERPRREVLPGGNGDGDKAAVQRWGAL